MTYKEDIRMKKKNLLIKLAGLTYSTHLNKFLKMHSLDKTLI